MQCCLASWQAPLSREEVKLLTEMTAGDSTALSARRVSGATAGQLSAREVLLFELKTQKHAASATPRLADVYFYNYTDHVAGVSTINLDTKALVSSITLDSVHLPLNNNEQEYVRQVLITHPELQSLLSAEYQRQFARPLDRSVDIDMKVSIRVPADKNDHCHHERCALVSIFTRELYNFSIEPVINLKRGTVDLEQFR